jgi:hypothetical protein
VTDPARPPERSARPSFVPPPGFGPSSEERTLQANDPRIGQHLSREIVNPTRHSFGVTFHGLAEPPIEPSLLQEVEANSAEEHQVDYLHRPAAGRFVLLAGAVFVAAIGLGFLGMLLWQRLQ